MKGCRFGCKGGKVFIPRLNEFVNCPEHGVQGGNIDNIEVYEGKSLKDALMIPEVYRGVGLVDREVITTELTKVYSSESIEKLVKLLNKINESIYNGVIPKISAYIHNPNLIDINMFVYGSQQVGLERGLSVVPYISANTLNGLQRAMDYDLGLLEYADNLIGLKKEGVNEYKDLLEVGDVKIKIGRDMSKLLGKLSTDKLIAIEGYRLIKETGLMYSDYIRAELCFIELTSNTGEGGLRAVADLMEERARRNIPTYVVGKYRETTEEKIKYLLTGERGGKLSKLVPFMLIPKKRGNEIEAMTSVNLDDIEVCNKKGSVVGGYSL